MRWILGLVALVVLCCASVGTQAYEQSLVPSGAFEPVARFAPTHESPSSAAVVQITEPTVGVHDLFELFAQSCAAANTAPGIVSQAWAASNPCLQPELPPSGSPVALSQTSAHASPESDGASASSHHPSQGHGSGGHGDNPSASPGHSSDDADAHDESSSPVPAVGHPVVDALPNALPELDLPKASELEVLFAPVDTSIPAAPVAEDEPNSWATPIAVAAAGRTPIDPPVVASLAAGIVFTSLVLGSKLLPFGARILEVARRALLAPLYARFAKHQVLNHATRQAIVDFLGVQPGASIKDIRAVHNVATNTLNHHLRVLETNGFVHSARAGRRRCFYVAGDGLSPQARQADAILSAPTARNVFQAIRGEPGISQSALAHRMRVSATSIVFHVRRLERVGVIRRERQGRVVAYYPGVVAPAGV